MYYYLVMQSNSNTGNQHLSKKRTFIEEARRTQIIEATIDVLAEHGYINTSFARIATQADISASLISYHFKDKDELTKEVYKSLETARSQYVKDRLASATTYTEKLHIALESDIANMSTNPKRYRALLELVFGKRNERGSLVYTEGTENTLFLTHLYILEAGQKNGEFGKFDAYNLAMIIEGARDAFLAQLPLKPRLHTETFITDLIALVFNTVLANKK